MNPATLIELLPILGALVGNATLKKLTVMVLQEALNVVQRPNPPLAVDGYAGPATRAALMAWQKGLGLPSTGIIADVEWTALQFALSKTAK